MQIAQTTLVGQRHKYPTTAPKGRLIQPQGGLHLIGSHRRFRIERWPTVVERRGCHRVLFQDADSVLVGILLDVERTDRQRSLCLMGEVAGIVETIFVVHADGKGQIGLIGWQILNERELLAHTQVARPTDVKRLEHRKMVPTRLQFVGRTGWVGKRVATHHVVQIDHVIVGIGFVPNRKVLAVVVVVETIIPVGNLTGVEVAIIDIPRLFRAVVRLAIIRRRSHERGRNNAQTGDVLQTVAVVEGSVGTDQR